MSFQEKHKRSIAKAITFRIMVMFSDFVIITTITHSYNIAIGIIIFSNIGSTIFYYIHERIWDKISWGRK